MFVSLILTLTTVSLAPAEGVKFFEGSWQAALKEAAKVKKPILVEFYTVW